MKVEDISSFSAYTRNTEVQAGWWSKLDATRRAETRKVVNWRFSAERQSPVTHREELYDEYSSHVIDTRHPPSQCLLYSPPCVPSIPLLHTFSVYSIFSLYIACTRTRSCQYSSFRFYHYDPFQSLDSILHGESYSTSAAD